MKKPLSIRVLLFITLMLCVNYSKAQIITSFASGIGNCRDAVIYGRLSNPQSVAVDPAGNVVIADGYGLRTVNMTTGIIDASSLGFSGSSMKFDAAGNFYAIVANTVQKRNVAGNISIVVGTGSGGFSGDGGQATAATLNNPSEICIDNAGNIYIADKGNGKIRKVGTDGVIHTIAGGGSVLGDGGPATAAAVGPTGVVVDGVGNIYITDNGNGRIRKINTSGNISTFVPSIISGSEYSYLSIDGSGNLYVTNYNGGDIIKVSPAGITSSFATGLNHPLEGKIDAAGNLYTNYYNTAIKINPLGVKTTIAGNGLGIGGNAGDGGQALLANFNPGALCANKNGDVYITDVASQTIRKIATTGLVSTVVGSGIGGQPYALTTDFAGNFYVGCYDNGLIRKVNTSGIISTIAGGGSTGIGDGGLATAAQLSANYIASDSAGNIYVADVTNARIRKITAASNIITTICGNGVSGDGGPATAASVTYPTGITLDKSGNIYFGDRQYGDHINTSDDVGHTRIIYASTIRRINTSGIVTTIAGGGSVFLDGGPATASKIYPNGGLVTDSWGNVYFSDYFYRVFKIDGLGYLHVVAGNGIKGYAGDCGTATEAHLSGTYSLTIDSVNNIYIVDGVFIGDDFLGGGAFIRKVCCLSNTTGNPPVFTHGGSQVMQVCVSSSAISIDTFLTMTDADAGSHIKWSIYTAPTHGALGGFNDSVIATGGAMTPSGTTYTPTAGYSGTDNFTIKVSDGYYSNYMNVTVTVSAMPYTGSIFGATSVCPGATVALYNYADAGVWSTGDTSASISSSGMATGLVTGLNAGTSRISYTVTNACGSASSAYTITVNPLPFGGTITGPPSLCAGYSIILSNPTAIGSGVWTCADPYVGISTSSGIVTGIASGTATVSYTTTNSCGTTLQTKVITVNPIPWAGSISGITSICTGGTSALSSTVAGGTWTSGNPFVATVNSAGVVSGVAGGAAIISYTLASLGCGSAVAAAIINIAPATTISPVTGPGSMCAGTTATLNDASPGGTWSSSNTTVATVNSAGVVTGVAAGVATISYTANLGCGVSVAASNMIVQPAPAAGAITGTATICMGADDVLTASVPGGVWSSSNGNTTVSPTGVISGITTGASIISYTFTNSCGSANATHNINVYTTPVAGIITGTATVCTGASTTFTNSGSGGGIWTSGNIGTATVNTAGAVTGINTGTAVISYTVTTGCGTAVATKTISVNATSAGNITGVTTLCAGGTSTLSSSVTGGTWTSSTPTVVAISSTGVTSALAGGVSMISYTVSGTCGVAIATTNFTVGSLPVVAPISGITAICTGSNTTYTDVTSGGVWSSSNPSAATVGSTGMIVSVSAGTTLISYMVTAGCGTAGVVTTLNVEATPNAGTLTGSAAICAGATTTLAATISGGTWSSNNILVAVAGTAGHITGMTIGTATITYTVTNACGAVSVSKDIAVEVLPAAIITGASELCPGNTATLSNAIPGGVWSSSAPATGTISSTGIVTALAPGTVICSYAATNSCGTSVATHTVNIYPVPDAGIITGVSSVCAGTSAALSVGGTTGGSWISSNILIAAAGSTGTITGLAAGNVTITYDIANICGSSLVVKNMTVDILTAGSVTGVENLCPGSSAMLSSTLPGGIWSNGTVAMGTISSSGMVTAIATGTPVFSYAITNSCGTAVATHTINIYPVPGAGTIAGASLVCSGNSIPLTVIGTTGAGNWSSSNTLIATIGTTGILTGVAEGTALVSYMVSNACGSAVATKNITVNVLSPGTINGITTLCPGGTASLSCSVSGGTWSSSAAAVATIGGGGIVTAVAPGNSVITYATSGVCGTAITTANITVGTLPVVAAITGGTAICIGNTTNLSDFTSGGVWTSSSPLIAAIGSTGTVTGLSAGISTISYMVTAGCGTAGSTIVITIEDMPLPGIISGGLTLCLGITDSLHEDINSGAWSSADQSVAIIDAATGVVTGIAAGSATLSYTVANSCGTATATAVENIITVPDPGVINGITNICEGDAATLTATVSSGTWSSGNTTIASVSNTGFVAGNAPGTAVISYSVSNICGTNNALQPVNIHPLPSIDAITGPLAVIKNNNITLTNTITGGLWSSSNATIATINANGIVTGIASGTAMITYAIENSLGCHIDTSVLFTVINDTGSTIPVKYGFSIYPNPTTNGITISWYNQPVSNAEIVFFDIAGKEITKNPISVATANGLTHIGLAGLPAGMYTYKIKSVNGDYNGKLVVLK